MTEAQTGRAPVTRRALAIGLIGAVLALLGSVARAGGGVVLADDTCILTVGFYEAHFTAYQPQKRGDQEFCEDLPDAGETLFVLDYLHESLAQVPVDFRIVRDYTGLGRFVRVEDLTDAAQLAAHTVFYRPPAIESDASYQVRHVFDQPGPYVGIVTAGHPSKDKIYTAVFPFAVGSTGFPYGWVLAAAAFLLLLSVAVVWLRLRPGERIGTPA